MKTYPIAAPSFGESELENLREAMQSGWISSQGKFIPEFEKMFAHYCGVEHGVATSNGTTALHLALVALGISGEDEVIIPALTFIATANAVKYTGATPILVDAHSYYWGLDPGGIEAKITPNTKAIIPVHLYGHPCDMDSIFEIANKYNLAIVEDAAEAHGAEYKGRKVGSFGHISCFSFYGNKIITTGEGGMCVTSDVRLAERMRILRDHGMNPNKKYWHDSIGFNYRMTNMQAGVGVAQASKLNEFVTKKREIAKWYKEELTDLKEQGYIELHPQMSWAASVYWMYSIILKKDIKIEREELQSLLLKKGIESRPFFYPVHQLPPYKQKGSYPIADYCH